LQFRNQILAPRRDVNHVGPAFSRISHWGYVSLDIKQRP